MSEREMTEPWHHIYIIGTMRDGRPEAPVKVGISNNPSSRFGNLQTASPHRLVLFCTFLCPGARFAKIIEGMMHDALSEYRMNGEWFGCHPLEAASTACELFRLLAENNPDEAEAILDVSGVADNLRHMTKYAKHIKWQG